jgi:nitrate/nitrite transporter NarK
MPLVMIESLGIRRLGSVMGITGVFFTLGAATSPVATGRIFDVTGSYSIAIWSFVATYLICSLAILGCRPLAGCGKTPDGHELLDPDVVI